MIQCLTDFGGDRITPDIARCLRSLLLAEGAAALTGAPRRVFPVGETGDSVDHIVM